MKKYNLMLFDLINYTVRSKGEKLVPILVAGAAKTRLEKRWILCPWSRYSNLQDHGQQPRQRSVMHSANQKAQLLC